MILPPGEGCLIVIDLCDESKFLGIRVRWLQRRVQRMGRKRNKQWLACVVLADSRDGLLEKDVVTLGTTILVCSAAGWGWLILTQRRANRS